MTYFNQTQTRNSGLSIEISAAVHHAAQAFQNYRAYRATVKELSQLDDATLADLGFHRCEIKAQASQAVYGV